jgi:hypothetical protein
MNSPIRTHPVTSLDGFQSMPSQTRAERFLKLEQGEVLLYENANRALQRYGWKHMSSASLPIYRVALRMCSRVRRIPCWKLKGSRPINE